MEGETVDGPAAEAASGSGVARDPGIRPAPIPLAAARLWRPRGSGPSDPRHLPDLPFFRISALREIVAHVRSRPETEVGGLLLGGRRECPVTGRRWIVVDEAVPLAAEEGPETTGEITGRLSRLEAAVSELRGRREAAEEGIPVGWYRSHALLGLFLSEPEARFHDRGFPDPWSLALVLDAGPGMPAVVFRREGEAGSRRTVRIPLCELPEAEASGEGEEPGRTGRGGADDVVTWRDYVPEPSAEDGPGREAAPGAPGGAREPRGRDGRLPDGPGPEGGIPLLLPPEAPGRMRRLWWRWRTPILALLAVAFLAGAAWATLRVLGGGEGEVPVETSSPASGRFAELHDTLRDAVESYRDAEGRFEAGEAGCPALQQAYLQLDQAFLELASHVSAVRERLGRSQLARYEAATSEVSELDREYQASGCPRPD